MPTEAADNSDDDNLGGNFEENEPSRSLVPVRQHLSLSERSPGHRAAFTNLLNNAYEQTLSDLRMTFNNLPRPLLKKKLTQEGVTVNNLPAIFDGLDTYFKHVIAALRRHPELVPEEVDKENLKHAFMGLAFIQQTLDDMVEIHGQKRNGRGISFEPGRFIESDERPQNKFFTSLDIGAQMDGRKGRHRELSAAEKATLKDCSHNIVVYAAIASHLLGVQLVGYKMVEKEEYGKFNIEHLDIPNVNAVAPPEPWAEAMKGFSIKIPTEHNPNITLM